MAKANAELAKLFDIIDVDHSNTIEMSELREAFLKKGLNEITTQRIFRVLDANNDGKITRDEYFSKLDKINTNDKLIFTWFLTFERYDVDNSGYLDKKEFAAALKEASLSAKPEDVAKFFKKVDANSDDKIEFKEFLNWKAAGNN